MDLFNEYINFILTYGTINGVSATLDKYKEFEEKTGYDFFEVSDILRESLKDKVFIKRRG